MSKSIWNGFGILSGIFYPFLGVKMLWQNPSLWQYLVIPIIINISVGIASYIFLLSPSLKRYDILADRIVNQAYFIIVRLPEWSNFLVYIISAFALILKVLLFALLLTFIGFVILQFGSLIGSPWYGKLSEKIEIIHQGKLDLVEINILAELGRAVLFELKKWILILTIGIPLFVLNFIPSFGNMISLIGGFLLTITVICLDFFDATLERKRLKFRAKLKFIWGNFPLTLSFGFICLSLISIPLVNLIVIPICVSGATLLICDIKQNSSL